MWRWSPKPTHWVGNALAHSHPNYLKARQPLQEGGLTPASRPLPASQCIRKAQHRTPKKKATCQREKRRRGSASAHCLLQLCDPSWRQSSLSIQLVSSSLTCHAWFLLLCGPSTEHQLHCLRSAILSPGNLGVSQIEYPTLAVNMANTVVYLLARQVGPLCRLPLCKMQMEHRAPMVNAVIVCKVVGG